jgi:transposase
MAMTTMPDLRRRVTGGVDTHKDLHVAAVLDEVGRVLASATFAATRAGYRQLWRWLAGFGDVVAVGVEGTGSWGAGLARSLTARRVRVIEVDRPNRQRRRRHGKSDPADAIAAARAVQAGEAIGTPKSGDGTVEAIRQLRLTRHGAVKARTQAANQLHSLVDTAPAELRHQLGALSVEQLVARAARFRCGHPNRPHDAAKLALRSLARRWQALDAEISELDDHLDKLTAATAPTLRALCGIGPHNAAALLVAAGDNPHRLRSAASFAALCGTSPIDASSGRQQRHRLNRGGDRQANSALYLAVITRLRWHQPAKNYMTRRTAQGRTNREIIRCLKRYLAIEAHHAICHDLTNHHPPTPPPTAP